MRSIREAAPAIYPNRRIKLDDLVEFRRGLTYKKRDEVDHSKNAVLRANNIDRANSQLDLNDIRYIDDSIVIPANKKIEAGSILICTASGSRSHLGKSAYIENTSEYAFGGFMGLLVPHSILDGKYLHYFMQSHAYWDFLNGLAGGTNINNLKFKELGELTIPLPELDEQKRIVAVLDQAFAALDRAQKNAGANLVNATALFEQARLTALSPDFVPAGWTPTHLGECIEVQSGFAFRSVDYTEQGHFLIRIANVQDGALSLHKPKYVELDEKTRRFELNEGDVLTSLTGNIGRVAEVHRKHLPAALNQRVARLLMKDKRNLSRDFFMHFLRSSLFGDPLREKAHGAAQLNVSPKEIANVPLLLPPLDVQEVVADKLDKLWNRVQILRNTYELELSKISQLRHSLLQRAFSGELAC